MYNFILTLNTLQKGKAMALPSNRDDEYFISLRIFCPTNIRFIRYHRRFCGKPEEAVRSSFVEQLFSKLLKNFEKTQVLWSDFNKFLYPQVSNHIGQWNYHETIIRTFYIVWYPVFHQFFTKIDLLPILKKNPNYLILLLLYNFQL